MTSQQRPNLDELIQSAKAGDIQARDKLFAFCSKAIASWAGKAVARMPYARVRPSDIAQEASLHAVQSFERFRGHTQGEWLNWLEAIVDRCSQRILRDARRCKRDVNKDVSLSDAEKENIADSADGPSASALVEERWHQILCAINELPEDQHNAIWLFHLKRLRVAQVAEMLGKTENQVNGLLQRGMMALRDRLASESSELPGLASPSNQLALSAAWTEYLWLRESRQIIDIEAFIADHPDIADELRSLLAWVGRIEALELKNSDDEDEND